LTKTKARRRNESRTNPVLAELPLRTRTKARLEVVVVANAVHYIYPESSLAVVARSVPGGY